MGRWVEHRWVGEWSGAVLGREKQEGGFGESVDFLIGRRLGRGGGKGHRWASPLVRGREGGKERKKGE